MFCGAGSIGNAFPVNSKPPAPSCAKSHQNSTLVQLCGTCLRLPKNKVKENGHCPKKLAKAFDDYLAKEGCLEDPFQNKHSGTINPYVCTPKLLNNTKNVSINKTLSITNLAQYFYPATLEEHPINNYDPDRVLLGKHAMERKCINSYTGLGEASSRTHSRTKSWNVAQEGTTVGMRCPSAAA